MYYNVDCRVCLDSKLHEDSICGCILNHLQWLTQNGCFTNGCQDKLLNLQYGGKCLPFLPGSPFPPPLQLYLSAVRAVMLWGWGCLFLAFSAAYSLACDSLGLCSEMHIVKQNGFIHQDTFKSGTLLSFYYPWMWAPRGAMLIFPLSGMVIQEVFTAE